MGCLGSYLFFGLVCVFDILSKILSLQYGDMSLTEYYSSLMGLFEELNLYQLITLDANSQINRGRSLGLLSSYQGKSLSMSMFMLQFQLVVKSQLYMKFTPKFIGFLWILLLFLWMINLHLHHLNEVRPLKVEEGTFVVAIVVIVITPLAVVEAIMHFKNAITVGRPIIL